MVECLPAKSSGILMKREILTTKPNRPFLNPPVERKSYDEIVDFFARGYSSPAEVLAFRPSDETIERVRYLLDRNAADELTDEEARELECLGEVEHFMQLVKARAQAYIETKT
jgi:hypothetical protein